MTVIFDQLIDSYLENKIGIQNTFFSKELCKGLQQNIKDLFESDSMELAKVGNTGHLDPNQKMRGDRIHWLDKSNNNSAEQEFLELIEAFISRLNSTCYTGISSYEFHYALYEKGSLYKRHKDQFKSDNKRKFSMINYLNDNWIEEDGGALLVYQEKSTISILPQAQIAVFFKSDEMEHEVALCHRDRMSITGWLKTH